MRGIAMTKTPTISDLADRIAAALGIRTDQPKSLILRRLRHWTSEGLLPVADEAGGVGHHRHYAADVIYLALVLNQLTSAGVTLSVLKRQSEELQRLAAGKLDSGLPEDDQSQRWKDAISGKRKIFAYFVVFIKSQEVVNALVRLYTAAEAKRLTNTDGRDAFTLMNLTSVFSGLRQP
jgi:DNA-binding transcriptional MerR regulator